MQISESNMVYVVSLSKDYHDGSDLTYIDIVEKTIKFRKKEECIIRLPHNRFYHTKEEAQKHIRPKLPPRPEPLIKENNGGYICTRCWDLWE